jgi:hypothetical protein
MSFNNNNPPREGGNVWSAGSRGKISNMSLLKFLMVYFSKVHVEVLLVQIVMIMV